jgi:uncharacterized protein (UPF0297 family)
MRQGEATGLTEEHREERTRVFHPEPEAGMDPGEVLVRVYRALQAKGHNPVMQLVGYLLSGDPAYITSYQDARSLVRKIERDEIIEELVRTYLAARTPEPPAVPIPASARTAARRRRTR